MKVAISTVGSTGDIQPFLALTVELRRRGHSVRACSHHRFRERFEQSGAEFIGVGAEEDEEMLMSLLRDMIYADRLKQIRLVMESLLLLDAKKKFEECLAAFPGHDVLVCHQVDILAQDAAIRLGIPWVGVLLCPGAIRSRFSPPMDLPDLGPSLNRLMWRLSDLAVEGLNRRVRDMVREVGGERPDVDWGFSYSDRLNLVAASAHIGPPPRDLPPTFLQTGAWFLDETSYEPPADLADFMAGGEPPVVVSFGSMSGGDGEKTARLMVDAIRRSGRRGLIQSGWGNLRAEVDDVGFCFADFVPHDWLFPRACCVVHHGGAGTTAAACRAGVPSIVVPHLVDQPYWADRLRSLGVAPRAIGRRGLNARGIHSRLEKIDVAMRSRALSLGERVRQEPGVRLAADAIERLV